MSPTQLQGWYLLYSIHVGFECICIWLVRGYRSILTRLLCLLLIPLTSVSISNWFIIISLLYKFVTFILNHFLDCFFCNFYGESIYFFFSVSPTVVYFFFYPYPPPSFFFSGSLPCFFLSSPFDYFFLSAGVKSSKSTHTRTLSYNLSVILSFKLRSVPSYNFKHLGSPTLSIALGSYFKAAT